MGKITMKKIDNDSFYDQFAGDAPAITPKPKHEPVAQVVNQFANREDLSTPYESVQQKVAAAPSFAVITSGNNEWMKLITNRNTPDDIAKIVNLSFTRNEINGDNFNQQKEKYLRLYAEQLNFSSL